MGKLLKPCPFCGNKEVYIEPVYDSNDHQTDYYKVVCEKCNASFECGNGIGKQSIIEAWNKRA